MEELHRTGGIPDGWSFGLPRGDAARGRQVFVDLECYACHMIRGEQFPASDRRLGRTGPELTGMGKHHPPEYFAESILDPNAVIVEGPGYTGPDGLSIMPSFAEALTVTQLADLVAYLRNQTGVSRAAFPRATGTEGTVWGRGVVRAVVREAQIIVIAHEEIPGVMPPMTMGFRVASAALYEVANVGDIVSFALRLDANAPPVLAEIVRVQR